jgi:hypothetical protein
MFKDDESQALAFGIPVDAEYLDIARQAWRDLRLWVQYGPKDLTPANRARNELVQFISDHLRKQGAPRPIATAWELVGEPGEEFDTKIEPGQPLGDLTPAAVLAKFRPLILSRLKHFGATGDEDAQSAAQVGLLNALAEYDPAIDASVGWYAKAYFHIDNEIKNVIHGKESDAWYRRKVSGDEVFENKDGDDSGEESGDRWGVMPTTLLPDDVAEAIEVAHDDSGRLHRSRIPFWVQTWVTETHVRREFGAREENWMDLPATSQEMAEAFAKIPPDKIARSLAQLSEREREIIIARFHRKPPILLNEIARGALDGNRRVKISYKETFEIAYKAALRIAGQIKVKRPIRRPERMPPPPRQLPFKPWRPPDHLEAFRHWWTGYEIRRAPRLDRVYLTVHKSRYYPAWTIVRPDPHTRSLYPVRVRLNKRVVIIIPETIVRFFGPPKNIFDFSNLISFKFTSIK